MSWAERLLERTWAVENATGLGYLVAHSWSPPASGRRCATEAGGPGAAAGHESTSKNGPLDALSVAIAALRSPSPKEVGVEDHAAVMKLWARRHRNLSSSRTQIAGDIAGFPTRDRFANFNGTAPFEVSSGGRKVWRLWIVSTTRTSKRSR